LFIIIPLFDALLSCICTLITSTY